MDKNNLKKSRQLGMPTGTASAKLKKMILFHLVKLLKLDTCFRCKKKVDNLEDLTIEHKVNWLDSKDPVGLFFDINNIAFSHLHCNCSAAKTFNKGFKTPHGTRNRYDKHKCRCSLCTKAQANYMRKYRLTLVA